MQRLLLLALLGVSSTPVFASLRMSMQRLLLLALLGVVLSTLNGCAMSDEDKDFYGRGWIRPTDLDQQYPHHSGTPAGTTASAPVGGSSADQLSTTADPAHDSAWDVPGARPQ